MSGVGRKVDRREFGVLALLAALGAGEAAAQAGGGSLGASRVLAPRLMKTANASERWAVLDGTLATGEAVSMHESVVPAGTPSSPAHTIQHSELIVLVEGTLGYEHDGVVETAHAGSVLYVAYGTNHRVWNVGDGPARYFVWQMGGDTKKG